MADGRPEHELQALLDRLHRRHAAVVALSGLDAVRDGDLSAAARAIAEAAAGALGVARAGVWMLTPDFQWLECLTLFDAAFGRHGREMPVPFATFPRYFAALREHRAIDAADARTDPRTSELREVYLLPLGISSMLDAAVRVAGSTVGVVCLEHTGPARAWSADEVAFVGEVADLVALTYVNRSRRQAEERLRLSEANFRDTVLHSPVALAVTDLDYTFTLLNDQFIATTGYTLADIPTVEHWYPRAYPDAEYRRLARTTWENAVAAARAAGRPMEPQEWRVTRKDGEVRDIVFRITFLTGRVVYSLVDVTDFRRAEQRLRQSEADFRDTVLHSPVPLLVAALDGRLTLLNGQFVETFGYAAEDVPTIDAWFGRAYPGADDNRTAHQIWQRVRSAARDGAETFHLPPIDHRVVCKDGSVAEVIVRLRMFHGKVVVTLQDVTDDRRVRAELARHRDRLEDLVRERTAELAREVAERRRAEEEARSADRLKSAFLATMSHELRTPLNSILGFTGILLKGLPGPLTDEQRKQLGMVQSSSRHLLALINDILDLSKIEAGQFELRREPFDLRASVEHAARSVAPLAEKKGLKLHTVFGPGLGPAVGDVRRTEQVLLNLLSNAIKFTDAGEVSVWCEARDGWAVTSVRDTGIGIAEADLPHLFRPFHQLDNGLGRKHEGTGLGLAICKRLVGLMGGTIRVDSEPGRGSAFTFTLPQGPRAEP